MSWLTDTTNTVVQTAENGGTQASNGAENALGAIVDAATAAAPPPPTQSSSSPGSTRQSVLAATVQIIDSAADFTRSAGDSLGHAAATCASPGSGAGFGLWLYAVQVAMSVGVAATVIAVCIGVHTATMDLALLRDAGQLAMDLGTYLAQCQLNSGVGSVRKLQSELSRLDQQLNQLLALLRSVQAQESEDKQQWDQYSVRQGEIMNSIRKAEDALADLRDALSFATTSSASPRVPGCGPSGDLPVPYLNLPRRSGHLVRLDGVLRHLVSVLQSQPPGTLGQSRAIVVLNDARHRLSSNLDTVVEIQQQLSHPKIVRFKR